MILARSVPKRGKNIPTKNNTGWWIDYFLPPKVSSTKIGLRRPLLTIIFWDQITARLD
ncbi:MAG: hypothetical protein HOD92_19985 [Deltaproteobacteria bacterium]|nr:hypothetical protein [Deltaproteobacteria bacterium]